MKRSHLFTAWGALFMICALFGLLPEPEGALRWLLTALSMDFFVPPALLLLRGDAATRKLLRWLSVGSLGLTVLLLILNVLSIAGTEALGDLLYTLLAIVSTPMVCSGYWVLSLFCWACLLVATFQGKK